MYVERPLATKSPLHSHSANMGVIFKLSSHNLPVTALFHESPTCPLVPSRTHTSFITTTFMLLLGIQNMKATLSKTWQNALNNLSNICSMNTQGWHIFDRFLNTFLCKCIQQLRGNLLYRYESFIFDQLYTITTLSQLSLNMTFKKNAVSQRWDSSVILIKIQMLFLLF